MAKLQVPFEYHRPPERRVGEVRKIVVLVILGAAMAPVLVEGAALCIGGWAEVAGTRLHLETPLLSWSGSTLEVRRQWIGEWILHTYQEASWEPGVVLPILAALLIIAMWMLRR